jgi:hypothetical protein
MSIRRLIPDEQQVASADDLYTLVTDRPTGARVDCASCARRHERDALTWFEIPSDRPEWIMAAICDPCTALSMAEIERAIIHRQPPVREAAGRKGGRVARIFLVCDPDYAMDRAS